MLTNCIFRCKCIKCFTCVIVVDWKWRIWKCVIIHCYLVICTIIIIINYYYIMVSNIYNSLEFCYNQYIINNYCSILKNNTNINKQ